MLSGVWAGMKRKRKIFKHFYAFVLLLFILQVESQATAEHTREVESENSNVHVPHGVQGLRILKTQKLKSQDDTEHTQLETRSRDVVGAGDKVAEVVTNDLVEPQTTESAKLGRDGGKKVNAAKKNTTSGRNTYVGSGTSNPSGDGAYVTSSEELEHKKKQKNSPTGPLVLRSLKSYDIPDISETVARELCQSVRHSRIRSSHSFLWAALKNPSTRLKNSFSLVAPRFFPGCYKWRWSLCGGKPQPPLLENCGFFSTVRIEDERCGYVIRNTNTGRLDGPLKETAKNCPCDWPCLPFFDPIQNCRWNLGDTTTSSAGASTNDVTETSGGFPATALYLNHGRAEQLCRAVEKTKSDMSFLVKSIPIQVQLDSHTSQTDECVQWKWEPCSGSSVGADDGNTDLRRRRSTPADDDDIGVVKIGWLDENKNNGSSASSSDGNGTVGPSQINGGGSSTSSNFNLNLDNY